MIFSFQVFRAMLLLIFSDPLVFGALIVLFGLLIGLIVFLLFLGFVILLRIALLILGVIGIWVRGVVFRICRRDHHRIEGKAGD